jgi:hypothetical protein
VEEQYLGAIHREGGNEHGAATLGRAQDRSGEGLDAGLVLVDPVAVCGLDQHRGGSTRGLRRQQDGVVGAAQVSADQQVRFTDLNVHAGRAQDVTCPAQLDLYAGQGLEGRAKVHGPEALDGTTRIVLGIEGQRRRVLGEAAPVREGGILLLDVPAVGQHDLAQRRRVRGGEHVAPESAAHQRGQVARMIQMRVTQHHRIDGGRVHAQPVPVAQPQLLQALEETAIHQ